MVACWRGVRRSRNGSEGEQYHPVPGLVTVCGGRELYGSVAKPDSQHGERDPPCMLFPLTMSEALTVAESYGSLPPCWEPRCNSESYSSLP